jgi:hypothetical protein
MNRRSRTRFKTDLTVNVTCLDRPDTTSRARLADLSVHGLSLIIKEEFPIGSLVKVEWDSAVFVGELVYCKPHGPDFLAGLKVEDPVYETTRKSVCQ